MLLTGCHFGTDDRRNQAAGLLAVQQKLHALLETGC